MGNSLWGGRFILDIVKTFTGESYEKEKILMDAVGIIRQLLIGISSGMVTFMGAAGVSLVVSGMNLLNFTQGAFFMLGAFVCWSVSRAIGFWWALLIAPIVVAMVGGITELLMRSLYRKNMLFQLILTMGIAFILIDGMQLVWGKLMKSVTAPVVFSPSFSLLGSAFPTYYILIIIIAILFAIGMWLIFEKTKLGMIFRAIISDREMVDSLGINVTMLYSLMFMVGVWMSGVAGVLMAPIIGISSEKSFDILFSIMMVIVIAGITSMRGTLFAALIVGIANALGSLYLPWFYTLIPPFLMILVLLIRPEGLFVSSGD
jgi:branched-subunit amino acid ABC-type transport system permease component